MKREKTITYQGTDVATEIISEVNVWPSYNRNHEVYDSILRDEAGRYYLHRDCEPGEHVHQISLTAAIIWATRNLCNGESRPLYFDTSNLLTEGRGVTDPPPFPYMSREEWQASDEYKALYDKPQVEAAAQPETPSTITYQGRVIEAELIGSIDDDRCKEGTWGINSVYRDAAGQYYLEHERHDHPEHSSVSYGREHPEETNRRCRVHRMSLTAAILYAIRETGGGDTENLRRDARAVLVGPEVLNPTRRFSDGSMVINVHFKPEVASLLRTVSEWEDDTPLGIVWTGARDYIIGALTQGRQRGGDYEEIFADNSPDEYEPAQAPMLRLLNKAGAIEAELPLYRDLLGRLRQQVENGQGDWQHTLTDVLEDGLRMRNEWMTIHELDDLAVTLLRRYHRQEYGEARYEKVMPGDVVNGVLVNWLEAMMQIHEGRTDGDAIEQACSRRRHGLSDEDDEVIKQVEQADEEAEGMIIRILNEKDGSTWADLDLDAEQLAALKGVAWARKTDVGEALEAIIREAVGAPYEQPATNSMQMYEDGGMAVTLYLKPEPAGLLRGTADETGFTLPGLLYDAARQYVCSDLANSAEEDREYKRIFEENAPVEEESPGARRLTRRETNQILRKVEQQLGLPVVPLHGLNAAAPEAVSADEVAAARAQREGHPAPMFDVLADLAAGWRIEGAEKGGRIANVLSKCADALEAAIAGKEGR